MGTLTYAGDRLGHRGIALSMLAAALAAGALVTSSLRRRRHPAPHRTRELREPAPWSERWRRLLTATLALIVATPVISRLAPFVDADWLAVIGLTALAVVVVAAARADHASR